MDVIWDVSPGLSEDDDGGYSLLKNGRWMEVSIIGINLNYMQSIILHT